MILEMSDCGAKFLQMERLAILRCEDQCTMKDSITFNHNDLQKRMNQLQSSASRDLISGAFQELFEDAESVDSVELVQVPGSEYLKLVNRTQTVQNLVQMVKPKLPELPPKRKKTKFNNPPVPRTKVPSNPCTDPAKGAPSAQHKRAAKCTLKKSPRCYKLQGRFLQIQAKIADERDQLMDDISSHDQACQETKKTLESSIESDGSLLSSSQTKLAAATEKEASEGERCIQQRLAQADEDVQH